MTEFVLCHREKPWTTNAERTWHHHKRARFTAAWREAFWGLALGAKVGRHQAVSIVVEQTCKTRRRPDTGACFPAVKAAVDGLVDARVIPDDTGEYLTELTFLPPVTTGEDSLTLIVRTG